MSKQDEGRKPPATDAGSMPDAVASPVLEPDAIVPVAGNGAPLLRSVAALASRRSARHGTAYLLIDCSASMADGEKLLQAKRGIIRFYYEGWRREYGVGVVTFADRARLLLGAGGDFVRLQRRLAALEPNGRTAMAAAIGLATRKLRRRRGDRLIVLITDGLPDSREATLQAAAVARALGITLLAIGTDGADQEFLAALTPRPELATVVARGELEHEIAAAATRLAPQQ